jgi:glycosyltransferase involved in cell wall biosynthesis
MSESCPAVSIIVPAHQVTAYIGQALDSILAQTFTDYEIIVINDGCPDTVALESALQGYATRIRYLRQENGGVGAARRTAVLAARAPLIAQLDPDDWWEPTYLEAQLTRMSAEPDLDMVYPNGYYFGDPSLESKLLMEYSPSRGEVTFCRLISGHVNIVYSAVIRKDAILRAGNFDPDFRTSEDFDLWIRILKTGGRIAYHRLPLVHYRKRAGSLTSSALRTCEWITRVLDKTERTLALSDEEVKTLKARRVVVQMERELLLGKQAVQLRDWTKAQQHIEQYRCYRPSLKISSVLLLLRWSPRLLGWSCDARDGLLRRGFLKARTPENGELIGAGEWNARSFE